ncbi:MAG: GtrA family protein [Sporolactobacillus sp.]
MTIPKVKWSEEASAPTRDYQTIRQALLFAAVGVLNTAIDVGAFMLLTQVFGLFYGLAQVLSYSAGTLNSYICNSRLTFAASKKSKVRFVKFVVLNGAVLLLTIGVLHIFLFLPLIVDKLISTFVGLVFNFVLSKCWVFKA